MYLICQSNIECPHDIMLTQKKKYDIVVLRIITVFV